MYNFSKYIGLSKHFSEVEYRNLSSEMETLVGENDGFDLINYCISVGLSKIDSSLKKKYIFTSIQCNCL